MSHIIESTMNPNSFSGRAAPNLKAQMRHLVAPQQNHHISFADPTSLVLPQNIQQKKAIKTKEKRSSSDTHDNYRPGNTNQAMMSQVYGGQYQQDGNISSYVQQVNHKNQYQNDFMYGAQPIVPKDRKNSVGQMIGASGYYDALIGNNRNGISSESQSQRLGSSTSNRINQYIGGSTGVPPNHNNSLFSQISNKDNNPSPKKIKMSVNSYIHSRNLQNPQLALGGSLMMYSQQQQHMLNNNHIQSHQTQQISIPNHIESKPMLKNNHTNDKLARHFIQTNTTRKSNENNNVILHPNLGAPSSLSVPQIGGGISGSNSQSILNINTASDINIYNNSFIVNTTAGKKQSASQSQSRSNSQKRNCQNITGVAISSTVQSQNGYNPVSIKKQMTIGKQVKVNSASGGMMYGSKINQESRSNQEQQNKTIIQNQRISSSAATDHAQKFNPISDAYSTSTFFPIAQTNERQVINQLKNASQKKIIRLSNRKQNNSSLSRQQHQLQQLQQHNMSYLHSQLNPNSQQNHTQSFDLQPFNSSSTEGPFASTSVSRKMSNRIKFNNQPSTRVKYSSSQNRLQRQSEEQPKEDYDLQMASSPTIVQKNAKAKVQSQSLLGLGKKKILEKDYQKAISLFSEAIQCDSFNSDAKFYRALSYLDSGQNQEAISELKQVIQKNSPEHAQISHILLSIAYKRNNNQPQALQTLNDCISKFPAYSDAYLARGQAFLITEQYEQALKDFSEHTNLMPQNGVGFVGVGDSHKAMRQWQHSVTAYTQAITLFQLSHTDVIDVTKAYINQATFKRGLDYYHLKLHEQAMIDFQDVIKVDVTAIKAQFYIGKIYSKQYLGEITSSLTGKQLQKTQSDAILHFEQVVKYHQPSSEVYAGNALFEIAKLRLHDKDFYEAYFNLKRAVDSNFTSKRLQLYKDFTEGVLYLIKRKIKKGVQILSDLLEILVNSKDKKDRAQLDYLRHQSYIYRAYGYVAIEKYEVALQDIKRAKKITKLDAASIYNKLLGKGILRMDHEDYLMATKYFIRASTKFSANKDPYCLYIISIVRSYSYSHSGMAIDQQEKKDKIMQAKNFMDVAITNCNVKVKVPSLYFFRGLLYFQMQMFYEAIKNFNIAIDEEEEPTASYYLARGRAYACLSILSEAMKDLSIALNLDETLQEAYIFRGKCAYLLGDNNLAFLDFQRLILTDPKNPMVHVYAGNLLMTTGAYQDAIKAFMNADTVQKTAVAAFQRGRCFCALTDLENAKMQFKIALQLCKADELITIDSQILTSLMRVINASQNSAKDNSKSIQAAIDMINTQIEVFQSDKIYNLKKKDSPLNIQIIPNVKRIKIEKVAVAKDLIKEDLTSSQKQPESHIDNENNKSSLNEDMLSQIQNYSYYYENVFSLEDLYLFRAVFHFYSRDYLSAINDFEQCSQLKMGGGFKDNGSPRQDKFDDHINNQSLKAYSYSSTPMLSMNSSKTDLSDVGLCSLNVHETNYNILLCCLMMKDYKKALEIVNELIGQTPGKYQRHFFAIRGFLYEETGQKEKSEKDLARYQKQEPKFYDQMFREGKDFVFEPFPTKTRLCSRFDNVKHTFKGTSITICVRPSFSMPFIKPPNMIPNINEETLQEEFSLKQIDAPMPEAPWIRRWLGDASQTMGTGIKFTDNILLNDDEDDDNQALEDEEEEGMSIDYIANQKKHKIESKPVDQKSKRNHMVFQDESPYMQSLDLHAVPINRVKLQGISEQIIHQANTVGQAMVYQLDDALEVDQLSDQHKISLFDDSRYEDASIKYTLLQEDQYQNSSTLQQRKHTQKGKIRDSLYDESLIDMHNDADDDEDDEDDDESSGDGDQYTYQVNTANTKSGGIIIPPIVAESMVLMGENREGFTRKRKGNPVNNIQRIKRPMNLVMSGEADHSQSQQKLLSDLEDFKEGDERESIFKSRQSSKR